MLYRAKAYLNYRLKARGNHYIHSPFVFELTEKVFKDERRFYAFELIELLRHKLLASKESIEVTDYGAGSHKGKHKTRSIHEITKNAGIAPKYGQFLFRLVHHLKPKVLLEMGTSFGLSTLYQANAAINSTVITIEGCPQTADIARNSFDFLKTTNIQLEVGPFVDVLPSILKANPSLDYVYLDGHHEEQATLDYFEILLPHLHNDSVVVLDDIHWSAGMNSAWNQIRNRPEVTVSINYFQIGLLFFRKEQVKEHFVLL